MTRENINETKKEQPTSSRKSRDDDRDSKKEVILPDGRKLTRRPTENLGEQSYKLSAPKKEGFYRRWVSDAIDGNVQHYIDLGFVPATDEDGKQFQPRRGGVRKEGGAFNMFLMEIPLKEYEKLKERYEKFNPSAQALKQQEKWLNGEQLEEGVNTYQPGGKSFNKIKNIELR